MNNELENNVNQETLNEQPVVDVEEVAEEALETVAEEEAETIAAEEQEEETEERVAGQTAQPKAAKGIIGKIFGRAMPRAPKLQFPESAPIVHDPENLLEVKDLRQYFPIKAGFFKHTVGYVRAVDGITFNIKRGTTMGLVGESGCGKTTTGRTILRLYKKTAGQVLFDGKEIFDMSKRELRHFRPQIQIVFQDPYSSLSPRLPVAEIIGEAVREHKIVPKDQYEDYITKIMRDCGLPEYYKKRYPHEFSGGQRQRICIARALALNPQFIICDEPVSALDVSIQAQIINLFKDLQKEYGLTYLFISHDLSVVEHISDTVGVMYLGDLVEYAETDELFAHPAHPYTQALFSAIPIPDPKVKMNRIILEGSIPSPANPPKGCKFHTRCSKCMEQCKHAVPPTVDLGNGHYVKCHLFADKGVDAK